MKDIRIMDINEIKGFADKIITRQRFKELSSNINTDYIELWEGNNYIINTIDGDYFDIYLED